MSMSSKQQHEPNRLLLDIWSQTNLNSLINVKLNKLILIYTLVYKLRGKLNDLKTISLYKNYNKVRILVL